MQTKTINYYNTKTREFIDRTINADMDFCRNKFLDLLKPGASVLDAGCGSGRDSRVFLESGYDVQAIDASVEMCRMAAEYIGQPVRCMRFDEMAYDGEFDGIWACASLLHVRKEELPAILRRMHKALRPGGILYASVKYGDAQEERLGRFFSDYRMEELKDVFSRDRLFETIECFETEDVRPDYKEKPWVNILVRKK